jgi:hypothetical protein
MAIFALGMSGGSRWSQAAVKKRIDKVTGGR